MRSTVGPLLSKSCSQASLHESCHPRRSLGRAIAVFATLLAIGCQPGPWPSPPSSDQVVDSATTRVPVPSGPTGAAKPEQPQPQSDDTPAIHPDSAAWLEWAGLGPDAATSEDWSRIQAKAGAEGQVVLYSDTSRSLNAAESLTRAYPGLRADAYSLGSHDIYLRLLDDAQEGRHAADVYLVGDAPRTLELLAQHRIWNYVPADLSDLVPQEMREPLLVHHWSAVTLIYNTALSKAPPIDNWWALTGEEWRGRVALPDPIAHERTMYLLITLVQHSDELAAAYRAESGHELVLDADCPNAGYQWIKDLLANEPILLHSDAEVAGLVGDPDADQTYIGIGGYEQYEKVARGKLSFAPIVDGAPTAGLQWPTYLGLVDRSPRPNAAKLLVRWLMGDETGGGGYSAWHYPGFYPARSDVPDPKGVIPREELQPRLWQPDAAFIADNMIAVRDQVAAYMGREVGGR